MRSHSLTPPTAVTVVDRALRGEATRDELRRLIVWRAADPSHERCVRETEQLLQLVWRLRPRDRARIPTAAHVIARGRRSLTLDRRGRHDR